MRNSVSEKKVKRDRAQVSERNGDYANSGWYGKRRRQRRWQWM